MHGEIEPFTVGWILGRESVVPLINRAIEMSAICPANMRKAHRVGSE